RPTRRHGAARHGWHAQGDRQNGQQMLASEALTLPRRTWSHNTGATNAFNSSRIWLTIPEAPVDKMEVSFREYVGPHRAQSALAAASAAAAWPSTFTVGQTCAIRPSGPIR